ncbi:hypothetical protein ACWDWO_19440 [Actinopolymorpha singaporensis]|uniref:Uncharacterized protein n=1 Tax=Actinopolymorpha singaporensis TaxID=117157 RepID=A0A1H1WCU3_9ACTN|nr:hypothetical protein [Actinopolymorpha singaporensis]SDS95087.1 hypothetical protein SAMN04489717_4466 [Actinopolymorpha singaporensis]
MAGKGKLSRSVINYAVKYGPLAYEAVKHGREPAQRAVTNALARQGNRRQALKHAGTVVDGSVLRVFHRGEQVWVVFAGESPIAAYPGVDRPLPELLEHADLNRRVRPGEEPTSRLPKGLPARVPDAVRKLRPRRRG